MSHMMNMMYEDHENAPLVNNAYPRLAYRSHGSIQTDNCSKIVEQSKKIAKKPWYSNKKLRKMAFIGFLMTIYSIGELGFAVYLDSLVMIADGLHNASDSIALAVAFWAEKKKMSPKKDGMTYGWRRTEIMGGLFNGMFLLSTAMFITLQALPNFINPNHVPDDRGIAQIFFIAVAGTGIGLNIVGMTLFSDAHGHSHGDGGSHSEHGHGGHDHNMWGLFVHFLGDVFTSLLVLAVGLIYKYSDQIEEKLPSAGERIIEYADPVSCILSAIIIIYTAWGLVKSCAWILLQTAPAGADIDSLSCAIMMINGVHNVHELHLWQLVDGVNIATLHFHLMAKDVDNMNEVIENIRKVLHKYEVHNSSIQPEIVSFADGGSGEGDDAVGCVLSGGGPCVEGCNAEPCCSEDDHAEMKDRVSKRLSMN